MNHIRITSEGTSGTTKVTIVETGEEIGHLITAIKWHLDCNTDRIAWAEVTLICTELDVKGEVRALIQGEMPPQSPPVIRPDYPNVGSEPPA